MKTVVWLTGIPSAGKTTIAAALGEELRRGGHVSYNLDGDALRTGLNADLSFTTEDRAEAVRRASEVAKLMADAGLIVIVSMVSPFREGREHARALFDAGEFIEIHVDAPVETAAQRDPKGLYRRAQQGELHGLTGIDSPYEAPAHPELRLDTTSLSPRESAQAVMETLERMGRLPPPAS